MEILQKSEGTISKIKRVADLFDYDAEVTRGIVLLRKRYTNPDDLPAVSFEELRDSVKESLKVIAPFCPQVSGAAIPFHIRQLLEQLPQSLQTTVEKEGILVRDLSAPAGRSFINVIGEAYFGGIRHPALGFEQTIFDLSSCYLTIHTDPGPSLPAYGFVSTRPDKQPAYVPFSSSYLAVTAKPDRLLTEDKFDWNAENLEEIVVKLNSREDKEGVCRIQENIKKKPITSFGLNYGATRIIMYAMADLYGLNVTRYTDGWSLNRPVIQLPNMIHEVQSTLRLSTPLPIQKAMKGNYYSGAHRLINSYAPKVTKRKNRRVNWQELTPKMQAAVTIFLLTDYLVELKDILSSRTPLLYEDTDKIRIVAQSTKDSVEFKVMVFHNGVWKNAMAVQSSEYKRH
ncbi:MAG: hypothetical protein OHK0029_19270 [Armatimonadaceae bacterium]